MKIWEWAIHRGITTAMLYALVMILGAVAIPKIPLEFMPKMDIPFIEIHVPYEGASPVEVCDQIVEPIEEAISTLPGIKKVHSRCRTGYAYIGIELAPSAKMDYIALDVQERVDSIRQDLPPDVRQILIAKFDTEQIPVVFGAISFPVDKPENNELLDRFFERPLKTVDGVADVQLQGLEEHRVLVEIDQNRLSAYGINVIQVFDALIAANLTYSAGTVDLAGLRHSVRIAGEFRDLEEIRALPVTKTVKVGQVADVRLDYVKPFFVGRINRQRAYIFMILKESGANTVKVCRAIQDRTRELLKEPKLAGVNLKIWFDQSREITSSIDILTSSGIAGAILAFLILLAFLKDLRSTLIISTAIPMSILATTAAMYFLKISFNIITLSALIVAIGMLVDNSVVVLEAIDLHRRKGLDRTAAAIVGARDVGLAITASTTTTVIVFLPLIFSEQTEASVLMKQLGMVLSISIIASLVVSITLIPLLASWFLTRQAPGIPRWYQRMSDWFVNLLDWSLTHRLASLSLTFSVFLISLLVFFWPLPWDRIFKDFKFTPVIEKEAVPQAMMRMVQISVRFEKKPPIEEMDKKISRLEDLFMAKKDEWDLDTVAAIVTPLFIRIMLVLPEDRTARHTAKEISDLAEALLAEKIQWPGVTFDTAGEGMGGPPGMEQATSIKVRGPDSAQVYQFAALIRKRLEGVPGLKPIKELERSNEQEFHVLVDRDLARQYGFEVSSVAMAISYSVRGVPVGQMHSGDSPLDIYIQLQAADRKTVSQLESMMVQNLRGEYIPLNNIAQFRLVPIPELVRRDNRLITVRIPIEPVGRDLGEVKKSISARLQGLRLPIGYSWVLGEEFQEAAEDLMTLVKALFLAAILVFLVMTAQFESVFLPFVIMFKIPFAVIGVVVGLLVFRATFNVLSGTGCLLLIGVVVNNAIVLVDHVNNLRKQGLAERESLLQAARDRLRPIMMTALTAIMGLLPMALGFNDTGRMMYSPLAVSVLGGLLIGTFLTPFMIPVIYSLTDDLVRGFLRIWQAVKGI